MTMSNCRRQREATTLGRSKESSKNHKGTGRLGNGHGD
jgi:hypothetical protein